MGAVFTPDAVQQGRIPDRNIYPDAIARFVEIIKGACEEGICDFAMLYGSCGRDTYTNRSDIDTVVFANRLQDIATAMAKMGQLQWTTFIPINPLIVLNAPAEKGYHSIDTGFHRNLVRSLPGAVAFGDRFRLTGLPVVEIDPFTSHRNYLDNKLRKLLAGYVEIQMGGEEVTRAKTIQRALELPVNAGRRHLEAYIANGLTSPIVDIDSKRSVVDAMYILCSGSAILPVFGNLLGRDSEYSHFLEQGWSGSTDAYRKYFDSLGRECVPMAIQLTEALLDDLQDTKEKYGL